MQASDPPPGKRTRTQTVDNIDEPAELAADKPRRLPWILIAAVIALTLLAIWLVPDQTPPRPALPPLPTQPTTTAETPEPPGEAGETPEPVGDIPVTEGEVARQFIAAQRATGTVDLPTAYTEAERLRAAGQLADAWLLHFYAARQGHAPSALVLGTLSDPTYRDAGMGTLEVSDPQQALKWYRVAADAGDAEAARRLQNLRNRIEREADAGDADAQRLMLQWR